MKSVIGLDPGSEHSSFVHWNGKEILNKGTHPNEELLDILIGDYCDVASIAEDIILAVERMVHITNGGTAIVDTLLWAGQFYHAWKGQKEFVPRYKVTLALTGQMPSKRADKAVRDVLLARFGAPGTKKNPNPITYSLKSHLWQAFGLAVAHWDHLEFQGRELK